jgi:hypothetical protein
MILSDYALRTVCKPLVVPTGAPEHGPEDALFGLAARDSLKRSALLRLYVSQQHFMPMTLVVSLVGRLKVGLLLLTERRPRCGV